MPWTGRGRARRQRRSLKRRSDKRLVGRPLEGDGLMSLGTLPVHFIRVVSPRGILRHSPWDALFIGLAVVHGLLLLVAPFAPVIALGLWWNSNTISHNFIHKPFFRSR